MVVLLGVGDHVDDGVHLVPELGGLDELAGGHRGLAGSPEHRKINNKIRILGPVCFYIRIQEGIECCSFFFPSYLSLYLSIYLPFNLSIHLPIHLSI